jgi:Calcineurin-like phosphoesterase
MKTPTPSTHTRRDFLRTSACSIAGLSTIHAVQAAAAPAAAAVKYRKFNDFKDAVLMPGEPPAIAEGSFTIAVLPDTQKYAEVNPTAFAAQTEWIATNAKQRNIACALHLGDITDDNLPSQWELAADAMKKLDGQVPYFMVVGNHDYGADGHGTDRTTLFNQYFPLAAQSRAPTFGGVYDREPERLENSYHLFTAGGRDWLVLCLEFGPRKDVVRWANDIAAQHSKRAAILVTHAYMYFDDTRFDRAKYGAAQNWNPHTYKMAEVTGDDMHDGEVLWQALVSKHPNFVMTLNGHVLEDGLGRLTSTAGNRQIHQMLVNFQTRPKGGDGFLRLIEIKPNGLAEICDYSPTRNERNESPQNKFSLQLSPVV